MSRRVVVAGAGLAGLRAAEQLRAVGWNESLAVVGDELHPPYNRPPLTKEALRGGVELEQLALRQRPSTPPIEWRLGTRVVAADLTDRTIMLDAGTGETEPLAYDGLVVATGVRSRRLPLDVPLAWRHPIRTFDDARGLSRLLRDEVAVVVIGGGFIGCEVASSSAALGCRVTVVEPLETPLEAALGRMVGAEVQRRHEEHGVRFELGRSVSAVEGGAHGPTAVVLDDGRRVPATVVVEAVGSVPNTDWLEGQGLDLADGVLCDRDLHPVRSTGSVTNVVALGDVARFPVPLLGSEPYRIEHWNMAGDSAHHAARSLVRALTGDAPAAPAFDPLPSFWTDQCGVRIQSFGLPARGTDDVRVLEGQLRDEAVVGYHSGGALVGLVLLGMQRRMVPYRARLLEELRATHAEQVAS